MMEEDSEPIGKCSICHKDVKPDHLYLETVEGVSHQACLKVESVEA